MYDYIFTEECDQGDSFGLEFELEDTDLSGVEMYSHIKDFDGNKVAEFTITKTKPSVGMFDLELIENNLDVGTYYADILVIFGGNRKNHFSRFRLKIMRSVTHADSQT